MKFFAITAFVTAVLAAPYVVDPTNATDPMDTTGTTNSTGTVDPTSSWNTTDPTDPTSSWNTTDPTDPKSSWNSTDPTVPTKPWNSTDNTWTCKPISYICKPDFSGWFVCNAEGFYVDGGDCPTETKCQYINNIPYCI